MTGGQRLRVGGLLLAAGESQRMGASNKLLLPVAGQALLARSVSLLARGPLHPKVVVLGYQMEDSAPIIRASGVPFVVNPDFRDGQESSLRVGLKAILAGSDAVMVMLADLPHLQIETIESLCRGVQQSPDADAWVPVYNASWGNPRILGRRWCQMLCAQSSLSARSLFANAGDAVVTIPVEDVGTVRDIDTPDDYRMYLDGLKRQDNGFH